MEQFDILIIGSGTAAQTFLSNLDKEDRRIALIDCGPEFGGTCALRGCQPKKYFVSNTEVIDAARHLSGIGIDGEIRTNWPDLLKLKNAFLEGHDPEMRQELRDMGVEPIEGTAKFVNEKTLFVEGPDRTLTANTIIVAAGSRPRCLPNESGAWMVDSTGFMNLESLPKEILFVGAGYISMEFAHVAVRAGANVRMVSRGDTILNFFEPECTDVLVEASKAEGIEFVFNANAENIHLYEGRACVGLDNGDRHPADLVVVGIGRIPNTDLIDAGAGNLQVSRDGIEVGAQLRSVSNPNVFAIGDIAAAGPDLATIGDLQGKTVARILNGQTDTVMDYSVIPTNVFTLPNISRVGLGEAEAREQGRDFRINKGTTTGWPSSKRIGEKFSCYKILIENGSNQILGAHLTRHMAAEVINLFALAIKYRIPTDELLKMPWAYPTYSSDLKYMIR